MRDAATFHHLVTTVATVKRCRVCREWVLSGLCEGLPTTVGLRPVVEADALAAGLWTYGMWRGRLHLREDWGSGRNGPGPVFADHRH